MKVRSLASGVAAVVVATNVACSASEAFEAADSEPVQGVGLDIATAREVGATDEQIAVLEEAREEGEIAFEAYNEAVDRALRCMREADIAVQDLGVIEHRGVRLRSYSVPAEAEAADQREPLPGFPVHRCLAEHSFWVERAYQLQPTSVEAEEAHFGQYREAIIDCLAEHGIEVDPDLSETSSESELAAEFGDDVGQRDIYGLCLDETGYSR